MYIQLIAGILLFIIAVVLALDLSGKGKRILERIKLRTKKKTGEETWENIPKIPSTLTKKDFDRILIEEGILSEEHRTEVWEGRPRDWNKAGDEITEMGLRKAAKSYLKRYPESVKEDSPVNVPG